MLKRILRLFVIKTRLDAFVVIYALALGAIERGLHYLDQFPGYGGWLLFAACFGTVFMAGAKILDAVAAAPLPVRQRTVMRNVERRQGDRRSGDRRQASPARPA